VRRLAPLLVVALLAGFFLAGRAVRAELGLELSAESIQATVAALGWKAPAIFLGLVTFRQFLLLPSALVLPAGGVLFGAAAGTLLGALGILLSALYKYTATRLLGREWLPSRFAAAMEVFETRVRAAGPWIVALVTAHPTGPMTPVFYAAGFAAMPLLGFVLAVALGAPVRAFSYSFFGSTLLDPGALRFWLASALLVGVTLVPLSHRATRERLRQLTRGEPPPA
jgi:uncharacterized membrane protein YdjX (TVP38/TMEM64 family)